MHKIGIYKTENYTYPGYDDSQFRPSTAYPEYYFGQNAISSVKNNVYKSVRESLHLLGLDDGNFGTERWNPLRGLVNEDDNILIKPNLVMDYNQNPDGGVECLYTQPSVVAPVIDYILLATDGHCHITIGDAPMQECKFDKLLSQSGYDKLVRWYRERGIDVNIVDFRGLRSESNNGIHIYHIDKDENKKGKIIDLADQSEFAGESRAKMQSLRITNYDPVILNSHHTQDKNEYFVSDYVLNADVIINMPKPKSHRKAGVTIALKNFVGINVRKEYLPHHSKGSVTSGGDEYLHRNLIHAIGGTFSDKRNSYSYNGHEVRAKVYFFFERCCNYFLGKTNTKYFEGSWYGNHTISKTITDLNKIVMYAGKDGNMHDTPQRRILVIADMIISGEKEGPVAPSPKNVGIIAAGENQVCFDEAIARIMGFDKSKIPTLQNVRNIKGKYRLVDDTDRAVIVSNQSQWNGKNPDNIPKEYCMGYEATSGWKGHIEL